MSDYQPLLPRTAPRAVCAPPASTSAETSSAEDASWEGGLMETLGNQACVETLLCEAEPALAPESVCAEPWALAPGWLFGGSSGLLAETVCEEPALMSEVSEADPALATELVEEAPASLETLVEEDPELACEVVFEEPAEALDVCTEAELPAPASSEAESVEAEEEEEEPQLCATEQKDFNARARCLFSTIDADGDGHLSKEDIDNAMVRTDLDVESAATVAMLRRYRENLEELSNDEWGDEDDGVSLADLERYQAALDEVKANGGEMPEDLGSLEYFFNQSVERVKNADSRLFTEDGPKLDAISQGHAGTCSFLSTVGGMLSQGRADEIQRMMHDNQDGTYTVTFPGRDPVTVVAPTNAEIAFGASAGQNGMWLTVLEKAYGQLRDEDDETVVDYEAGEGTREEAIQTLTGHDVDGDSTSWTDEDTTHEKLQAHLAAGDIVTVGQAGENDAGIVDHHAYTVVGYDPATRMVTLRNPWGHNPSSDKAEITVPLSTLDDTFGDVTYEERR